MGYYQPTFQTVENQRWNPHNQGFQDQPTQQRIGHENYNSRFIIQQNSRVSLDELNLQYRNQSSRYP